MEVKPAFQMLTYPMIDDRTAQRTDLDFMPVANSGYEVARLSVADGVHVIDGTKNFAVVVVGYDQWDSYAYLGGIGTAVINPNPN